MSEGSAPTIEELQAMLEESAAKLDAQATEIAELTAKLAAATKREKKPPVTRAPKSAEGRKLGAMKPPKNDEEAAARKAALEEAFASGSTEVVFSDGAREIRELAPLIVLGGGWRQTPQGRVLNHEPLLEPGDCGRETIELRGFALVNDQGKQVAYHPLPDAVTLRRNGRVQLSHNTIRF